jgi:hypothetical protein
MTRCLEDKTLFLLSEGEANEEQRSHLQGCQACTERHRELRRDLRFITETLEEEAPLRFPAPRSSLFYRYLPIAAGVLLVIAFMGGESRLWRPNSGSEQTQRDDISQFLEQVSEAIFDGGNVREIATASPPASDLASLQVALGENCSDECRELLDNSLVATKSNTGSMDRPFVTAKKRPLDPAMQHMVSDRAE